MIVEMVDWKDQTLSQNIDQILTVVENNGYLVSGNNQVLVSSVFTERANDQYIESLNGQINEWAVSAKNNHTNIALTFQNGSMSDLKAANDEGMSFGRYIQKKFTEDEREVSPSEDEKINETIDDTMNKEEPEPNNEIDQNKLKEDTLDEESLPVEEENDDKGKEEIQPNTENKPSDNETRPEENVKIENDDTEKDVEENKEKKEEENVTPSPNVNAQFGQERKRENELKNQQKKEDKKEEKEAKTDKKEDKKENHDEKKEDKDKKGDSENED